jgi:hypothetical protein
MFISRLPPTGKAITLVVGLPDHRHRVLLNLPMTLLVRMRMCFPTRVRMIGDGLTWPLLSFRLVSTLGKVPDILLDLLVYLLPLMNQGQIVRYRHESWWCNRYFCVDDVSSCRQLA